MAGKENKQKKQEKKPAHEVLLIRIKSHYASNVDGMQAILSELGIILNTMMIPADKISEVRRELMNIFSSTPATKIPVKNIEAFRYLVEHFQRKYPEQRNS